MKLRFFFCLAIVLLFSDQSYSADSTIVKSPDGLIAFKLFPQKNSLYFTVTANGNTIIASSPMEMSVDGVSITQNTAADKIERYTRKETYPVMGAHATATDHCNGAIVSIASNGGA